MKACKLEITGYTDALQAQFVVCKLLINLYYVCLFVSSSSQHVNFIVLLKDLLICSLLWQKHVSITIFKCFSIENMFV